ncbi:MAG: hypothetical protein QG614_526 [Patescibacteria group bacterium]|nr:hypothetical protein [Patescibacteria group bacterium]
MSILDENKISEMYDLLEENNKMLRALLRRARIASFMKIVYLIIIFGVLFATYYYSQPYINNFFNNYNTMQDQVNKFNNFNINDFNNLKDNESFKNFMEIMKSNFNEKTSQ